MFLFPFDTAASQAQSAEQMSSVWKAAADWHQKMAKMTAAAPGLSMLYAASADLARAARDQADQMAGDTIITNDSVAALAGLEPASLSPEDRLEAREIGREERRGLGGQGPSSKLEAF